MLSEKQLKTLSDVTFKKTASIGLKHAQENVPYDKRTVKDLKKSVDVKKGDVSLVISAGPSLHKRKSLDTVKSTTFNGNIVAVDGSLGHCLRSGIVPDYVITVDPHPDRIIRWFGDPRLAERPEDDYFRRQDLDPALNRDEIARNHELIDLVNEHGPHIKVIISTSVNPEITRRCMDAGMELFWWNPIYDDYEEEDSLTRQIYQMNKVPCMATGGNCGTSAWVFSHAVLESRATILVGMDLSYPPGTNVVNTQYYEILLEFMPDGPEKGLIEVTNPYLKETWLTDPAYYWYTTNFLNMAKDAFCKTYNCTEGGILFGEGVEFAPLRETLELFK